MQLRPVPQCDIGHEMCCSRAVYGHGKGMRAFRGRKGVLNFAWPRHPKKNTPFTGRGVLIPHSPPIGPASATRRRCCNNGEPTIMKKNLLGIAASLIVLMTLQPAQGADTTVTTRKITFSIEAQPML